MSKQVDSFIGACALCSQNKSSNRKHGLYHPLSIRSRPWALISMDFLSSLLTTFRKHDAIWVVVCRFSKMALFLTISLLHYAALTGTIEDDMWIIDSGASRHMTGDQTRLSNLNEKKTSYKVELGYKSTYPVEGFGQASVKLKSGNHVHLSNVLYVPGLEKNLVSISCLEDKGNRIAFVYGEVLSWHKNSSIENARVIGRREGNLYRLLEQNEEALVHEEVNPNELWHRRYAHINYQALSFLKRMVEGIP
jgi:hypothetical protein